MTNQQDQSDDSSCILIVIGLLFILCCFMAIGGYIGYMIGQKKSPDSKGSKLSCPSCSNYIQENEYLSENACRLYGNYKDLYLAAEGLISSYDPSWNGSVRQIERYKAFSSWDSFRDEYCD